MHFTDKTGVFPVIEVSGGLGNQLFQYAFARKLKKVTGTQPVFSLLGYKSSSHQQKRKVEINQFLNSEFEYFPTEHPGWGLNQINKSFLEKKVWRNNALRLEYIKEVSPFNAPEIEFSAQGHYKSSLVSLHYWDDIFQETISVINEGLTREYEVHNKKRLQIEQNVLGIHIRRGDYISNPKTRNFHGFCSDEYYLDAVETMLSKRPDVSSLLIFTDDRDSCVPIVEKFRRFSLPTSFNRSPDSISSLFEMGLCQQLIGSNSTYSWWATHIGAEKFSIFPANWFAGLKNYDTQGFFKADVQLLEHELVTQ